MACGECGGPKLLVQQPRLSLPLARLIDSQGVDGGPMQMHRDVVPVVVLGDLSYASGQIGWRGFWGSSISPAVALRRSALLIAAEQGPFRIEYFQTDGDGYLTTGLINTYKSAMANVAVSPLQMMNSSGEKQGGASTLGLYIGDVDNSSAPFSTAAALLVNNASATENFYYPNAQATWRAEIPKGHCMVFWGNSDGSARILQLAVTEYKDFG